MSQATGSKMLTFRGWPKMIFLWPTAIVCLAMGLATSFIPNSAVVWGSIFMAVLGVNLLVLTFEFPRATSLTTAFIVIAIVLGFILFNVTIFEVLPGLVRILERLRISASEHFYYTFFTIQLILFGGMYFVTRFDYWQLTSNELVHHKGMLGDVERYSTAGLKLNSELNDVFEYILAGAGRIVMTIPSHPRPIILENVLNIKQITRAADVILEARAVRIDTSSGGQGAIGVPIATREEEET